MPRIKTLEEFDFAESKKVSAAEVAQLAKGEYIQFVGSWELIWQVSRRLEPVAQQVIQAF